MKEAPIAESLTEHEQEILDCLVEGLSNQKIAQRLKLAHKMVKWYNSQIYSKLGVAGRDEAIEQAAALNLLHANDASINAETQHNLPVQATPFIGWLHELVDLAGLIANPEIRLLTILAPGGMGKTRLALAAAERQLHYFNNGVSVVQLAAGASATCSGCCFLLDWIISSGTIATSVRAAPAI